MKSKKQKLPAETQRQAEPDVETEEDIKRKKNLSMTPDTE